MRRWEWAAAVVLLLGVAAAPAQEAGKTDAEEDPIATEDVESAAGEALAQEETADGVEEPAAAEPQGDESAAEEPEDEPEDELELPGLTGAGRRITFEIPFAAESGGGSARGSAGSLEYLREDYVVATEGVEMTHGDLKFQGDRVEIDLVTKIVTARGNVVLDQGPKRIAADTLVYDIDSETGKFTEATAYVDPDIYFSGTEIEKLSEELYVVKHGRVSSCSGEVPMWSFSGSSARINVEGYTRVRNTTMRVKKLPVLYAPFLIYPSSQERQSGFLFPNIGFSDRRGYQLGLGYYQTFGPSYDATFFADVFTEDFLGLGTEVRYRPTAGTAGRLEAYAIDDPNQDSTRWKATLVHTTDDMPGGMRGVVRISQVSDFNFFRDFERDFSQISLRRLNSAAYVTGNWGSHSFNFVLDELETFIRDGVTQTQRQLPEIEYILRPTRLFGLPLYLDVATSAHYFQAERTGIDQVSYGRTDLAPQITVPLSYWPWLSVKVSAGGRATYYEDSLTVDRTSLSGDSLTRTFPFGDLSVIGPSFSRIFDKKVGPFGKFKHIVEPRVTYDFVGDPSDQDLVPVFDTIDTVRKESIVTYALVNRLLAKPANENANLGAREIMSFELSQAYSLNDDQPFQFSRDRTLESQKSKIGARFRFTPALRTNFEARATYSTLFDDIDTASVSGSTSFGQHTLGLSWFSRRDSELDNTTSHQGRIYGAFQLIPARLRFSTQVNYDFVTRELQHHRHTLEFNGQCYGMLFEYRQLQTANFDDREIRFSLSLKNIGTFLDLNGGTHEETF